MKQWITLMAATAIFTACSKQDLQDETMQQNIANQPSAMRSAQQGAYVSAWEQYSDWIKTDEGTTSKFVLMRKTPEINAGVTNGGLVLSYAKVATNAPDYAPFTTPNMLPFYYLPASERPYPQTHYFSDVSSEGNIAISYRIPFTKQGTPAIGGGASLQSFQFQHVVLTKAFLDSRGLDAQTVRNYYTYNQVMNLVNPQ